MKRRGRRGSRDSRVPKSERDEWTVASASARMRRRTAVPLFRAVPKEPRSPCPARRTGSGSSGVYGAQRVLNDAPTVEAKIARFVFVCLFVQCSCALPLFSSVLKVTVTLLPIGLPITDYGLRTPEDEWDCRFRSGYKVSRERRKTKQCSKREAPRLNQRCVCVCFVNN